MAIALLQQSLPSEGSKSVPDYRPILLQSALLHKNTGAIPPVAGIAPVFSYRPIASKVSKVSFNVVISLAAAL